MKLDITVTHKEETDTKKKVDLIVRTQHRHSTMLRKIMEAIASAGDPDALKKLREELADSTDDLEDAVTANSPK